MNTFLPYADFVKSAEVLDNKRLGKQRVECLQLLTSLKENRGWIHHPCTKQWKGYENALVEYGVAICSEWIKRGFKDTTMEKISKFRDGDVVLPKWFGNENFHSSHRSNLLRKKREWYGKFGWEEPDNLPYVWPSKENV